MTLHSVPTLADKSLFVEKTFINGQWRDSTSGERFEIYDPATGAVIGSCPECTTEDLDEAITTAAGAFKSWKLTSGRERARILRRWYDLLIVNQEDLAKLITWENGKAFADAAGEVIFSASFLEFYSEEAPRIYGDVVPHTSSQMSVSVIKEPVGVCGLITPWNFPLGMMLRKVAPALAAGCTVVVKTDGLTPFTANAAVVLAERAGVPPGVINIVTALENTPKLGLAICKSDTVKKVSFTGSTRVGKILAENSASTLKKLSLELGGNAPFIVYDDADLDLAVACCVAAKFKSSGQTCVCANRIFVQDAVFDRFLSKLKAVVEQFKVGSGFDPNNTHGPLITQQALRKVEEHVTDAVDKGAQVIAGGQRALSLGDNFFQPTILTGLTSDMRISSEETFGPLAALQRFYTEDEAIGLANASNVGLAAYVMTNDYGRANRTAEKIETGMVAINTGAVSDAPSPFGGVKHSGLGREGGKYGIEEYLELKTIVSAKLVVKPNL